MLNLLSDSLASPSFSIILSKFQYLSLKVSYSFLIVSSTPGKTYCNSSDNCFCSIGSRTGFFGVIEIVLFDSSTILVIGLGKLSTLVLEGSGAIFGSLFRKGERLPSGNKKLVSLGSGGWGTNLERGGKSQS